MKNRTCKILVAGLIALTSGIIATSAFAQSNRPKPGPEHEQFAIWVGEWDYQGVQEETPLGPKGKFRGTMVKRLALNGYFLETNWQEDEQGVTQGLAGNEIHTYDAAKKRYVTYGFTNDGGTSVGIDTYDGHTCRGNITMMGVNGDKAQVKAVWTIAESGDQFTAKWEVSLDGGKTYMSWMELTATKKRNRQPFQSQPRSTE